MDGFYVCDIIGNSYTHENESFKKETMVKKISSIFAT